MGLINLIKVAGIQLADRLNQLNDPFEPFTRGAMPKTQETLAGKEAGFEQDLEKFRLRGETIVNYRIPLDNRLPLDLGDQSFHHGLATAAEAMVSGPRCGAYLQGLASHQPDGRLIRGLGSGRVQLDASNDQATGHLLGLYALWQWCPESSVRAGAAKLMDQWASNILAHGHALVNPDDKPTKYGQLIQGWKTDPLRLTLALAIYSVAHSMTSAPEYRDAFADLYVRYQSLIAYPKVRLWWIDTVYDTHRAAIHLAILAKQLPTKSTTLGLRRLRQMVAKDGNIWVNALCAYGLGETHPDDRPLALKVLSEFDVEEKRRNPGKDNAFHCDQRLGRFGYIAHLVLWNGEWMASQPLPRWAARSQDFVWQRNLYSLDPGTEGQQPDSELQGVDFLCAKRLSEKVGTITAND